MPAHYPYGASDRLSALYFNHDLKTNPQPTPPGSPHGGSQRFKQWIDTSVYPAVLRMCTIDGASATYIPSQWMTMGQIYWGDPTPRIEWGPQGGYLPLTGGTITGSLRVTGNVQIDGSITKVWDIPAGGTVSAQYIHATVNLNADLDIGIGRNLFVTGVGRYGGDLTTTANIGGSGVYAGYVQTTNAYVTDGLTVGGNIALTNNLTCYSINTSYETIYGNLDVQGYTRLRNCDADYFGCFGNTQTNGSAVVNGNITARTHLYSTYDVYAGRTVFSTGFQGWNIIINSNDNAAINVPAGGITAVHGFFGNRIQCGGNDAYGIWAPFCSVACRVLRFTQDNGYIDPDFYIYHGPPNKIFNYAPGHYWAWNMTNGDLTFVGAGQEFFQLQNGSKYLVNKLGPMLAWNYLYLSDRRSKTNIVPSEYGLDAVLALEPVKFNRRRKSVEEDYPPAEIGFVAQDLAEVIPEAVQPANFAFPDGSGAPDSDEPALAVTIMPIIGAMVKAFKQLDARLAALEGAK